MKYEGIQGRKYEKTVRGLRLLFSSLTVYKGISVNTNQANRNFLSRSLIEHFNQTQSYSWEWLHALADMWHWANARRAITLQMVVTELRDCTVVAFMANNWK